VVSVALKGERGGSVPGERLEIPDGFAALGEQGQAAMPEIVEPESRETGRSRSGLKCQFTTFWASRGVPLSVVNTSLLSSQAVASGLSSC